MTPYDEEIELTKIALRASSKHYYDLDNHLLGLFLMKKAWINGILKLCHTGK